MDNSGLTPRLNAGHYIGLQVLAIVAPPTLFILYFLPGRPRWRDLKINFVLLLLGWVPGVIHASIFLHDVYLAGHGQEVRCFGARISSAPTGNHNAYTKAKQLAAAEAEAEPVPEEVHDKPDIETYASSTDVRHSPEGTVYARPTGTNDDSEDSLEPGSTVGPLPESPYNRQLMLSHQRRSRMFLSATPSNESFVSSISHASRPSLQQSIQSSVQSFLSIFSHVSVDPVYQQHRKKCTRCTHCSHCFEHYVRDHKDSDDGMSIPLFSCTDLQTRKKHIDAQHHVPGCVCEACTGTKAIPPDLGVHVHGCKCMECRQPAQRAPRRSHERNTVILGPVGGVVGGGPAMGGY